MSSRHLCDLDSSVYNHEQWEWALLSSAILVYINCLFIKASLSINVKCPIKTMAKAMN